MSNTARVEYSNSSEPEPAISGETFEFGRLQRAHRHSKIQGVPLHAVQTGMGEVGGGESRNTDAFFLGRLASQYDSIDFFWKKRKVLVRRCRIPAAPRV